MCKKEVVLLLEEAFTVQEKLLGKTLSELNASKSKVRSLNLDVKEIRLKMLEIQDLIKKELAN